MKRNKKGFTLAELLVVVAIIAILVAVAIPVFTTATKRAEEAVEVANARATYGEGVVQYLDSGVTTLSKIYSGKTYAFTYTPEATGNSPKDASWKVEVSGTGTIYHASYDSTVKGFDYVINGDSAD